VTLGWSRYLGWFFIAGAIFNTVAILALIIFYFIKGNKLDVKYKNLTWD